MELLVVGCHGGETPHHRASTFVVDHNLAIDAGSVTRGLELDAQARLDAVLVSHAHLDHIRDLATLADNRCQMKCPPLVIAAPKPTIDVLKLHFFNDKLWPNFARIPTENHPTIQYVELELEKETTIAGKTVKPVAVTHTIDTCAFVVGDAGGTVAYSGDTGPTDRLWEVLAEVKNLRAMMVEVSFPNSEAGLAKASGHHTPATLAKDLDKLRERLGKRAVEGIPTLLYHIKPFHERQVEHECAALRSSDLEVLSLDDRFEF